MRASLAAAESERDRFKGHLEGAGIDLQGAQRTSQPAERPSSKARSAITARRWRRSRSSTSKSPRCAASSPRWKRRSTSPKKRTRNRRPRIADLGQRLNLALAQKRAGADEIPLRLLRPPARNPRQPARHPHRRRPLRAASPSCCSTPARPNCCRRRKARSTRSQPPSSSSSSKIPDRHRLGAAGRRPHRRAADRGTAGSSSRTGTCPRRARFRSCNISPRKGISPQRLVAAGFGEFQPIDDGKTDEAYRRNRRIEFKLTER